MHAEPYRHYHTLEHVGEVLKVAGRLATPSNDFAAIALASWFHDAICDPTRHDNEMKSAEFAAETIDSIQFMPRLAAKVMHLIEATAHTGRDIDDPDVAVLLDADLAILGAAEPRYLRYAADIRREYAHVPEAEYRAGRVAVLERFLSCPRIYRTATLFDEGEAAARANMLAEIKAINDAPAERR